MPKRKINVKRVLDKAIDIIGLQPMARGLGIKYQAIKGWQDRNRMPDTEFSGRTTHSKKIQIMSRNKVKVEDLLGFVPPGQEVTEDDFKEAS